VWQYRDICIETVVCVCVLKWIFAIIYENFSFHYGVTPELVFTIFPSTEEEREGIGQTRFCGGRGVGGEYLARDLMARTSIYFPNRYCLFFHLITHTYCSCEEGVTVKEHLSVYFKLKLTS
jgi:hypothetical protein